MINLAFIQTFCTVVETKSFTTTARLLYLSQPSVSQHVTAVENLLEAALIHRVGNNVELTHEGQIAYPYLKSMQDNFQGAVDALERLKQQPKGTLSIAATFLIGYYLLPKILVEFSRIWPDIDVKPKMMNTNDAVRALQNGTYPLILTEGDVGQQNIIRNRFAIDEMVLAVPSKHPWANSSITVEQLKYANWVIRRRGESRKAMENYLADLGLKDQINISMELGSTEALKEAVVSGMGISFISKMAIRHELQTNLMGQVKILNQKPCLRDLYVVWLKTKKQTLAVEKFTDFLMQRQTKKTAKAID